MSGYASLAATRRAFYALTALRWLPIGLILPIFVLYMIERGLTLAEVGLVSAVQAAVVLLLELPTGGLADAWGRRPVLALASLLAVISTTALLMAHSLTIFAVAAALAGVFRALDSGPLEAWYVDKALATDVGRNLEKDLSGAGVVLYAAVAAGSLLTGGLGLLLPSDPLTTGVIACLGLQIANLAAVLLLVREPRPEGGAHAARAAAARIGHAAARIGHVVVEGASLGWRQRPLRLLLAVELSWGAGLCAIELLWQPLTASEVGDANDVWIFGLIGASAWVAGALGSALLPALVRLTRGRVTWAAAVLRIAQAGTAVGLGLAGGVAGIMTAYVAFYAVHGMSNPAHFALLHRRVESTHRTTVMSLNSLVSRLSALPAGVAFGVIADNAGASFGIVVAGGLLATAAPLYLCSGEPSRAPARDRPIRPDGAAQSGGQPALSPTSASLHQSSVAPSASQGLQLTGP